MSCFSQAEHHVRSICNLLHSRDRRKYIKVLDINELDELEQVQRGEDLHEYCFSYAWHGMACLSMAQHVLTYYPQQRTEQVERKLVETTEKRDW